MLSHCCSAEIMSEKTQQHKIKTTGNTSKPAQKVIGAGLYLQQIKKKSCSSESPSMDPGTHQTLVWACEGVCTAAGPAKRQRRRPEPMRQRVWMSQRRSRAGGQSVAPLAVWTPGRREERKEKTRGRGKDMFENRFKDRGKKISIIYWTFVVTTSIVTSTRSIFEECIFKRLN